MAKGMSNIAASNVLEYEFRFLHDLTDTWHRVDGMVYCLTLKGDTILLVQCSTNGSTYDFRSQIWIQSCRNIKSRPYIRHGKQMYPLNVLLDRSNITSNAAMFFMHALKLH